MNFPAFLTRPKTGKNGIVTGAKGAKNAAKKRLRPRQRCQNHRFLASSKFSRELKVHIRTSRHSGRKTNPATANVGTSSAPMKRTMNETAASCFSDVNAYRSFQMNDDRWTGGWTDAGLSQS